jgi:predicted dehydrogenase/threonine dehydrogenase-like Zn-dependent dehydrogenase
MLQAIVRKGHVIPEQVPVPKVSPNMILIKVVNSCISIGTEISGVVSSRKSIIKRAIEKPENVKKVLELVKSQGLQKTFTKVKGKLEMGIPTGYSVSGIVKAVGSAVKGFKPGDKVAAAGTGLANHAEYVNVSENLVVLLPKGMEFKPASTVALGSIAMQGVRRADLKLGELCVVFGTGLLGMLTIQMLKASGIRTAAIDLDNQRLMLAKELGAEIIINPKYEDVIKSIDNWTGGYGSDAVIFTASTNSSEPLSQAFKMCKRKGRVVLVGVVGMEINREDIYKKELDFLISTSYGPGRYDDNYELKGYDYPYSYVRWTEKRNMEEYLRLVNLDLIKLEELTQASFPISRVSEAFDYLQNAEQKPLMVVLDYETDDMENKTKVELPIKVQQFSKDIINIALIGAGEFASGMHLPNLQKLKSKFALYAVMSPNSLKSKEIASHFGAVYSTTDFDEILKDKNIDAVLIATRHDSHASLVLKALKANKHVFVEKPLALNETELVSIKEFYDENPNIEKPILMVGFNRRFSNYACEIKKHTDKRINPLFIHYRMNAGYIPNEHWIHNQGGRIIGEACHIIDLMTYLTNSRIQQISCDSLQPSNTKFLESDNKSIILKYEDGSICTIEYFSVGSKRYPKEFMEIHFDEKTIIMDDYKSLRGYGISINNIKSSSSEKGQKEELCAFYESIRNKNSWPIEFWDLLQTTGITFSLATAF